MDPLPDYRSSLNAALRATERPVRAHDRLLQHALGATLAAPIRADRDQPPFDRATMDGYAVRAADVAPDAETRLRVIGEVAAGSGAGAEIRVGPGDAVKIATGAVIPLGADAVVRHEWTDRGHPVVTLRRCALKPGDCAHKRGSDTLAASTVLASGTFIAPQHVAIAASVGVVTAPVIGGKPRVWLVSSGDEVRAPETPSADLRVHQIRNSNSPLLTAGVRFFGGIAIGAEHIADEMKATRAALERGLTNADVVVTTGGVSAGDRDYVPAALRDLGVQTAVQGASIQPGRPIFVGALKRDAETKAVVVGLPGNPVSVLVTAHLYLWPILKQLAGEDPALPWRDVSLAAPVQPNAQRQAFRPCMIGVDGNATVPEWSGSGDLIHTAPTNGVVELPMRAERCEAGMRVRFLPWAWEAQHPTPAPNQGAVRP